MHSVLLVVEKSDDRQKQGNFWLAALNQIQGIVLLAKGVETLGENVWQFPLGDGQLSVLSQATHAAFDRGLQYRVLFFRKEPQPS